MKGLLIFNLEVSRTGFAVFISPATFFRPILEQGFEAQLDGVFKSESDSLTFLEDFLSNR